MLQEGANTNELKLHALDYWRVIRFRLPLITLVFLLVVITAGIGTYLTPRQYQSSVTMQVKEDSNKMQIFGADSSAHYDPRFATTQFQIIQRKEILYPVIDTLKLLKKWDLYSKDIAYYQLLSMMTISEVRNTDLIQISVLDQDRQEAADLANTIAVEYQKKRIDQQQGWVARSLVQLEDEVNKQRKKTEDLRDEMTRIRLESKINDLNPESMEDPRMAEESILISDSSTANDMRLKVSSLQSKAQQIDLMTDDQIMRSLRTFEMDDATISQILPQYEACVSEEARMLNSGLGPNHPSVKSLEAKKTVYAQQLKDQINVLRQSLKANLEIAQKSLQAMEQKLNEAKTAQQDAKTNSLNYQEAKNSYLKAKRILESAETRYSTEAMQRTMPQSPATIWEKAEVSDFPARPRVLRNMAVAVAVGLLLGVGLAFLIEYLDTSVKNIQILEEALGVPVLAVVSQNAESLIDMPSDVSEAEAYRIIRSNILQHRKSESVNSITVVSGGEGEGKSTTLNNLAFTFAKGGFKTLIIDADLRRPSQHRFFGMDNMQGLTDFLVQGTPFQRLVQTTEFKNLSFLPSGFLPDDEVDILNGPRMLQLIHDAKRSYDMVLVDVPPILMVGDSSTIAGMVDMTIVVVQYRRFPLAMLERMKQKLQKINANVIGSILNQADFQQMEHYEYYSSNYYGSYNSKAPAEPIKEDSSNKQKSEKSGDLLSENNY
ncbi:MAG: polysaccharide biosynthesis tyrosine autokinase [Verrucomicrobiota bacterium]